MKQMLQNKLHHHLSWGNYHVVRLNNHSEAERVAHAATYARIAPDEKSPERQFQAALTKTKRVLQAAGQHCLQMGDDRNAQRVIRMAGCAPAGGFVHTDAPKRSDFWVRQCQRRLCPHCHWRLVRDTHQRLASAEPWMSGQIGYTYYALPVNAWAEAGKRLKQVKAAASKKIYDTLKPAEALLSVAPALAGEGNHVYLALAVHILAVEARGRVRKPTGLFAFDERAGTLAELAPRALAYPTDVLALAAPRYWPQLLDVFHDHSRVNICRGPRCEAAGVA